jgi:riboflavin kinase/FMN adenylyltransferase
MFFDPHPTAVIAPDRAPVLLTSIERRIELLRDAGADHVAVLPFDGAFARTSPRVFVEDVLVRVCHAKTVVVGPDFHFGHQRAGNVETLRTLGGEHDFDVTVVPPVVLDDAPVSSTRIRAALGDGNVEPATRMLMRAHDVTGTVVEGQRRGRTLGFPTANLEVEPLMLPRDGVYAVAARRLDIGGAPRLFGVANLGVRPTVGAGRSVEAHFFDFDGDLYGARIRLGFLARIRDERRFDGLDALVAQIRVDADRARAVARTTAEDVIRWI